MVWATTISWDQTRGSALVKVNLSCVDGQIEQFNEMLENILTMLSGRQISSVGLQAVLRIKKWIPYLHLNKFWQTGTKKRIVFYLIRFPEVCLKLFNLLSFSNFSVGCELKHFSFCLSWFNLFTSASFSCCISQQLCCNIDWDVYKTSLLLHFISCVSGVFFVWMNLNSDKTLDTSYVSDDRSNNKDTTQPTSYGFTLTLIVYFYSYHLNIHRLLTSSVCSFF